MRQVPEHTELFRLPRSRTPGSMALDLLEETPTLDVVQELLVPSVITM